MPLTRERFDPSRGEYYEEAIELSWDHYLHLIFPEKSPVLEVLTKKATLKEAVFAQSRVEKLLALFFKEELPLHPAKIFDFIYREEGDLLFEKTHNVITNLPEQAFLQKKALEHDQEIKQLKKELAPFFQELAWNYEKLLLIDLYRLNVDGRLLPPPLLSKVEKMSLQDFREACGRFVSIKEALYGLAQTLFRENHFKKWREEKFKTYLADKRKEEKRAGKKEARPYIEYLDEAEKELFYEFWHKYQWDFLSLLIKKEITFTPHEEWRPYFDAVTLWRNEIDQGAHPALAWVNQYHLFQRVLHRAQIEGMAPDILISFFKALRRFEDFQHPLLGKYGGIKEGSEKELAKAFYPKQGYGYMRSLAFQQATVFGSIFKLVPAYEALRQRYVKNQGKGDLNPLTIIDQKSKGGAIVGYTMDGHPISSFYHGGRMISTCEHSGGVVGKIDLKGALEVSSNPYFSLLVGEVLEDAEDFYHATDLLGFGEKTGVRLPGEYRGNIPYDIVYNRSGLYAMAIGQHSLVGTPLQTTMLLAALVNQGKLLTPQIVLDQEKQPLIRREIFLPPPIQNCLLQGMKQVIMGDKGNARHLKNLYPDLVYRMIGKTSTAESIERMSLDGITGCLKLNHVGFGTVFFLSDDFSKPDLVVIVYLRHGGYGKDAAPIAARIVQKWKEIKAKHS